MKLGVIIPTRGDRPELFEHCMYLLSQQIRQPDEIAIIKYPPKGSRPDITQRYRTGFDILKNKVDVIAPFEDDDWYSRGYLKRMLKVWERHLKHSQTNLLGVNQHIVYHIVDRKYGTLRHERKAPMSNTLINVKAPVRWPEDDYVLTDVHIWNALKGVTVSFPKPISISIKHGTGLTCTPTHKGSWMHYLYQDPEMKYLKSLVDKKSFEFYRDYSFKRNAA